MEALHALHQRVSSPRLCDPAPVGEIRENIFRAALRAADHANLRPWRFLVVEADDRNALGALFERVELAENPALEELQRERLRKMPLRAPLVVVAIASCKEHPKVPESEQVIAAGAAVQNMLTAAFAQGVGAYWRTGKLSFHRSVAEGLGLTANEQIVGFLYLGTPEGRAKPLPDLATADFFTSWPQK